MPHFKRILTRLLICTSVLPLGMLASSAQAQGAHGISAIVNDDIVTSRDLSQRVLFMIATTGAKRDEETIKRIQRQALRNLVDEHIQMQESDKFDQSVADGEVNRAVGALFSRNGLDPNEVIEQLASAGVSIETLRDQIRAEIAWQRIVNGLYGSRIRISDAQIDETLNRLSANAAKPNYRVAEIYIESTPDIGGMDGAMEGARAMITQVEQGAPFPLLAQQFSSAPTAAKGGDIGWIREGELREEIDSVITKMEPGSLSEPIQVPGGVYVIALLDKKVSKSETVYNLKQVNFKVSDKDKMEEANALMIGLKDTLKSCETLKSDVKAVEGLAMADMGEVKSTDMSEQILDAISNIGIGDLTDPITTPTGPVSVMICDRRVSGSEIPTRDEIEKRLLDQQLAQASKRHLRDLRRKATIVVR